MCKRIEKLIVWAVFFSILQTAPALAGTAQYAYDNLNRLVQVQYEDGTIIQYTYDAAGNRLTKEMTALSSSLPAGTASGALAYVPAIPNSPPASGNSTEGSQ